MLPLLFLFVWFFDGRPWPHQACSTLCCSCPVLSLSSSANVHHFTKLLNIHVLQWLHQLFFCFHPGLSRACTFSPTQFQEFGASQHMTMNRVQWWSRITVVPKMNYYLLPTITLASLVTNDAACPVVRQWAAASEISGTALSLPPLT